MDRSLNFPLQPTPLVGRDSDLITAVNLLRVPHVRMLTVTGPAGVGKTRFAVELASHLLDLFPDGATFVDLAPLAGPELLITTIARALGITVGPDLAIWFTGFNSNEIGRMTLNGDLTRYPVPTHKGTPYQIRTGPDGALWFTEIDGNMIGRLRPRPS
jgi:hypothetical protein